MMDFCLWVYVLVDCARNWKGLNDRARSLR